MDNKYEPDMQLALAWCVFICVHIICANGTMVAQVLKKFRFVMLASTLAVFFMLCSIYIFYKLLGISGIIYGMAAGDVLLAILVWRLVVKECNV